MSQARWTGRTVGERYQIKELIGQGGMSAVYRAFDPHLERSVAIKVIHAHLSTTAEFSGRFREEATAVAQLRHPNIVQVYDFDHDGGDYYMVMEFLEGETLRKRLERLIDAGRSLPLADAMEYAIQISDAAAYAHQRKLIHRDIKPANVMINPQDQAILMDFGIARIVGGQQFTAVGSSIGTAQYMSPEQIQGADVDGRSDIYAIGALVFEMICGQPPFQAATPVKLAMKHLNDPVPDLTTLRPDCPSGLRQVVEKALVKEREQRYQSASALSAALRQELDALRSSLQAATSVIPSLAATTPPQSREERRETGTPLPPAAPSAAGDAPGASLEFTLPEVVTSDGSGKGPGKRRLFMAGVPVLVAVLLVVFLLFRPGGQGGEEEEGDAAMATVTAVVIADESPAATATAAAPAPRGLGLLAFADNDEARAGGFLLTMAEAGLPAPGSHYELWISDGRAPRFLGTIARGSDIRLAGNTNENLLASYSEAFITVEADGHEGGSPNGNAVFRGIIAPASLAELRLLVNAATESPGGQGYLVGAARQTELAIAHGGYLEDALAVDDLATAKQHAEHVVNILVGEESAAFGDLNGDGLAQNPGDGFGVAIYLARAKEHAGAAASADGAGAEVKLHAEHTVIGCDNALVFLDEAVQAAGRVLASDSVAEAKQGADVLASWVDALLNGSDANGDGVIAPVADEGGIHLAYEHALKMGSFEFFAAGDVVAPDEANLP